MTTRVVITGTGWITPLGHDIESVWANLLASKSGVSLTTLFDAKTFPTTFSAEVKDFQLADFLGEDAVKHDGASRNTQFALAACQQAWQQSELANFLALDPSRVGVYLGGGEGPVDFESCVKAAVSACRNEDGQAVDFDAKRWSQVATQVFSAVKELEQDPNMAAGHIAVQFKAAGPTLNTLTACAASTQAIGEAMRIIQYGDADVMISGGTHTMIHPFGVTGFNRLTALSTRNDDVESASRPFDRTRDGFVLGEGAGIVTLESLEHAESRGAKILAEVVGYGSTADAFRITDIHESGRGGTAAMQRALDSAGLKPNQIDYVSAHGTGTEENDKIETRAVKNIFGDDAKDVAISSVKSLLGHLIGAAGAVELITCVLAIRDSIAPPTGNYSTPDPNCDLDYVPNKARPMKITRALSNSFGFGGQNDTLIVQAFPLD